MTQGPNQENPQLQLTRADDRIAELIEARRQDGERWAVERSAFEARTAALETQSRRDFLTLQGITDASVQDFLHFQYSRTPEQGRPDFRTWVGSQAAAGGLDRWRAPTPAAADPITSMLAAARTSVAAGAPGAGAPGQPPVMPPNPGATVTPAPVLPPVTADQQASWLKHSTAADRMAWARAQQGAKR